MTSEEVVARLAALTPDGLDAERIEKRQDALPNAEEMALLKGCSAGRDLGGPQGPPTGRPHPQPRYTGATADLRDIEVGLR